MKLGLRARLGLTFVGVAAAIVLAYAAVVYVLVRGGLLDELDRHLHRDYEWASQAIVRGADGAFVWREPQHFHAGPDDTDPRVEIWSADGALLFARSPRSELAELSLSAPPPRGDSYRSMQSGRVQLRVLEQRFRVAGELHIMRIVRSTADLEATLRELLATLLAGLPLALVAAALAGYWYARRALAPVAAITERARAISAERLAERLPVANPHDELGRLAETFNQAFARLEESFAQLRRFTADAAHELRTPLAALRASAEVALRQHDPATHREALGAVLEETRRLSQLVEGLLLIARADQGALPVERRRCELRALAEETTSLLRPLAEERGQRVLVEVPAGLHATLDPELSRQALLDVVDNAIKHGRAGGEVRVSAEAEARSVALRVADDGPGLAPEAAARVFERFYRADPARSRGGFGLGLSIAKSLLDAQGGSLEFASRPDAGTTVTLRWAA